MREGGSGGREGVEGGRKGSEKRWRKGGGRIMPPLKSGQCIN